MARKRRKSASSKGALIKGMSRHLGSELLDDPLFQKSLQQIMRGYAGISALYRNKRLYYSGLTRNLLGRIKWHQRTATRGSGIILLSSGFTKFGI